MAGTNQIMKAPMASVSFDLSVLGETTDPDVPPLPPHITLEQAASSPPPSVMNPYR